MVDARDLKSRDRKIVRVRVPPSVLVKTPEKSGVLCYRKYYGNRAESRNFSPAELAGAQTCTQR